MRNFKFIYIAVALIVTSIAIYSCSKDTFDPSSKSTEFRSSGCVQSLSYKTKVFTFAKFDVADEQLTETELMFKMPKEEYFEYNICKKSDGSLRTEIQARPELVNNPVLDPNTIGIREPLKWKMIKENGQVSIFDAQNAQIDNYTSVNNGTIDDLTKLQEYSLIPASDYNRLIDIMRQNMNVTDFSQDIIIVTLIEGGNKTETFIDKRYQKEVLVAHYDNNNVLTSKTTYLYAINNNKVSMTNEIFETYKKSIDSNKIMTLVELTEYIYN
jgi:hypothetical protein